MKKIFLTVLVAALFSCAIASFAADKIFYPLPESEGDLRYTYPIRLLELVIKKSDRKYELAPSRIVMQQKRALKEIELGSPDLQIIWSMTSKEREKQLLAIRIPIDKGLLGWRLPLVMEQHAEQFRNVKSVQDLANFDAGQEAYWPDTEILRANGLKVVEINYYESTFKMLANDRFHYFPRSILEISNEARIHGPDRIVIDKYIAIHYPAASYFFVNKNNIALAEALRTGLERAIRDGSFDALFNEYHSPSLLAALLRGRTVIELKNPLLPEQTPLDRKELWYQVK